MIDSISAGQFEKKERPGIPEEVFERTNAIVAEVQSRGFDALREFSAKFDGFELTKDNITVNAEELEKAELSNLQKDAIDEAFDRVYAVQKAIASSALKETKVAIGGGSVSFKPRPIDRIGIYVPGGVAPLPSSLLMAGVAAKAAGVKEIIFCTPPQIPLSPAILYLADKLGINEIYRIGGAQAVAAMSFGIPGLLRKVDMVCGPGNVYVAAAKQIVSSLGLVKIDMVAGPSEVMIIADETASPEYVAADMLAQAEHGINSPAILLTTSKRLAEEVRDQLEKQLKGMRNSSNAKKSLENLGAIVLTESLGQSIQLANEYAPEHIEVLTQDAETLAEKITNAGAVFVNTCESFADYGMSGGNHILPTGGTARFLSGLSANDFIVRAYIEVMSDEEQRKLSGYAATFADLEGLEAHANAARLRGEKR